MTTEPSAELADKTRAYLTAHGWTSGGDGEAGALWTAPDGRQVAVPHWLAADDPMFRYLLTVVAYLECRQAPVVAAEIINPDAAEPGYTFARAWTWTRVEGTDVEILADTEVRLCARRTAPGPAVVRMAAYGSFFATRQKMREIISGRLDALQGQAIIIDWEGVEAVTGAFASEYAAWFLRTPGVHVRWMNDEVRETIALARRRLAEPETAAEAKS
jgi:anti-anti-sigma regulatory factor